MNLIITLTMVLALIATACSAPPAPAPTATIAPTATRTIPTAVPTAQTQPTQSSASSNTGVTGADEIKIVLVPEKSEARYRVREQLAGVNLPSDAVGATKSFTGTVVVKMDGTIVSSKSKFRVDMRTLKSDQNQRDDFLRQTVLNANRFPFAEFVPKAVKGLSIPPKPGDVEFQLIGDMTIRDVTKELTWEAKGKFDGNEASGAAKTNFNFAYFNITQPRVPRVLSIVDDIRLELDLYFRRE